jgi:diguanylate cyclase (GGDEF)-like protein/PAS domain S-box-containing protein
LVGSYDTWLVALSLAVATIASYVALDLASRVSASRGNAARAWLVAGAISMGTGIWSMHFIGMLAFRLPIPVSYDVPTTLASLLIAALVSGLALVLVSRDSLRARRLVLGGVLMGAGIASMHYTGMAAMDMSPPIRFDPALFTLSVLIAAAASMAALWIAFQLRAETIVSAFWKKSGSALVMGLAVTGMHYTGMAAANFAENTVCLVEPQDISTVWLAGAIGGFTVLFLAATMLMSLLDARLAERSALMAARLREVNADLEKRAGELARSNASLEQKISERDHAEFARRDSEERYRQLVELSPDAVFVHTAGTLVFANSVCGRLFQAGSPEALQGKHVLELFHADYHPIIKARLHVLDRERQAVPPIEERIVAFDGRCIDVEVTASPVDYAGSPSVLVVVRDISERKRFEQLQRMEHEVTRCLSEAENASGALEQVIQVMCKTLDWTCGRYFRPDPETNTLRMAQYWGRDDPGVRGYIEDSRSIAFAPGAGIAGKVWVSREPMWSRDMSTDARSLKRAQTRIAGVRGSFVFPVLASGEVLGVIALSCGDIREAEERLLQAVRVIGSQIGQFLRRKQGEDELQRFRVAMDNSADMIFLIDRATMRFVDVNSTVCNLLGYTRQEMLSMGPHDLIPVSREELERSYEALIAAPDVRSGLKTEYRCKDGSLLPFESNRRVLRSGDRHIIAAISRDTRERLAADERIRSQAHRQRLIAEFSQQTLASTELAAVLHQALVLVSETVRADRCEIMRVSADRRALVCMGAVGWSADWPGHGGQQLSPDSAIPSILTRNSPIIVEDYALDPAPGRQRLASWGVRSGVQMPIIGKSEAFGIFCAHTVELRRFSDEDAGFLHSVASILAVAIERAGAEDKLAYLAQFDSLTGLPNRHLFHDRLAQAMAHAKRNGKPVSVLFIDLDRFKLINDRLGHGAGDKLLKEAAKRLQGCVRRSDTVGRLGGDEFSAILLDLEDPADAGLVAQKILHALATPFDLDGQEAYVSASVGVTLCPADGEDAETLVMNADAAMYRAKEQGRNNYQYFTREMNDRAIQRAQTEAQLRHALERREFLLHYQPRVDMRSGRISGFEALLRWDHPVRGLISPLEFISILEDTGLIVPVGEWVIEDVCRQIAAWMRSGFAVPPVAINLSARQFQHKDLEGSVRRILENTGTSPALIQFEITESLLMDDPDGATRTLRALHAAGLKLSIDDFGTGYSSLAYLKRFPLDALKIDRAFVRDVAEDVDDAAITVAIIGLAHSLGLQVVAEGVETEAQLRFLSGHGCDEMQGFYFSRPVDALVCEGLLGDGRCLPGEDDRRREGGVNAA